MSFKIRNTIVLAALFVLITGGGLFYWLYFQPKKLKAAQKEIDKIEKELVDFPQTVSEVESLTNQLADTKRRYDSRSKEIPAFDITSQTYAYMSRGIDEAGYTNENGFVKFNMTYKGSQDFGNYGYNIYELSSGEGEFDNLYKFVYYLENGNRLYKVKQINFETKEQVDPEKKETRKWIAFTMELHAYYTKIQELGTSLAAKSLTFAQSPFDPFNPIILQSVSAEAPEDEIDVAKIQVKAVLPGKAFVLDKEDLIVLHLGDKVWRGYVSRISPADSKVEFTLNEGGIIRKVEKKIMFEKDKKKRP
ncbi:MAG: hypothetical protein HY089_12290 [Ignavibacteriales bacterium]|nr:hypothetical protein [Ignavibacteriales bacterium]